MSERPEKKPGRWRRRLRRSVLPLLVLLLVAVVGLWFVTRPHRLGGIIAAAVSHFTQLDAEIERATLRAGGVVELTGVRLHVPAEPGPDTGLQARRLFEVPGATLDVDLGRLLTRAFVLESVILDQPVAYLTEDLVQGGYTFQRRRSEPAAHRLPTALPEILLTNAELRFGEVDGEGYRPLGSIHLGGTLNASVEQPGAYAFILREQRDDRVVAPTLRGSFDLRTLRVSASLDDFSIHEPQRNLLPRRAREWWDRLTPQGSLPTINVAYDPEAGGLQAVIELEDGGLSLPYGEIAPRLSDVSARFVIRGETIEIEKLAGLVEDIPYAIGGTIRGFERDAAFELRAETAPFEITEDPPYISLMPPKVRQHYDRFTPTGRFRVEAQIARQEPAAPIDWNGRVDLLGARGVFARFPYPFVDARGHVSFSDRSVEIAVRGRGEGGGDIVVDGQVALSETEPSVEIRAVAKAMPIDDWLRNALEPRHRRIIDMFVNQERYEELLAKGVVRRPGGTEEGAEAGIPFEPGGRFDAVVEVVLVREEERNRFHTTVDIDTTGGRALMQQWPYPLVSEGGRVLIEPRLVTVTGMRLRGLTGGEAHAEGVIHLGPGILKPELTLRTVRLPVDELLLASVPSPQDQWVRRLNPRGTIAGAGEVTGDGVIEFDFKTTLEDGEIRPFGEAVTLRDFEGFLFFSREGVRLDRFRGRDGEMRLAANGEVRWAGDQLSTDVRLSAVALDLSPDLFSILPQENRIRQQLEGLWARWRPESRVDGELDFRAATGERLQDFTLTLRPHTLAFDINDQRVSLPTVEGAMVLRPGHAEIRQLEVPLEAGQVTIGGRVDYGDSARVALRLEGSGVDLDANARAVLPPAVVRTVDALEFGGGWSMASTLLMESSASSLDRVRFDGVIDLVEATADVGVAVRGLDGRLAVEATTAAASPFPRVDLRLDAQRLWLADRLVQPLSLEMSNRQRTDVLAMEAMRAEVYGGTLVGRGQVELAPAGLYQFDFTLQDVDLEPVMHPALADGGTVPAATTQAGSVTSPSGKMSASLAIEARRDDPASRRGRGALEVRDAAIFNRPVTMAVLQAANLSLPTTGAFDRASARYLLEGDLVRFDTLRFESPGVSILGSGTMEYTSQRLNLTMVTRNPGAPGLGALGEALNVFKDELIAIEVTGDLANPKANLTSFEGLRETWQQIFGGASASRHASDPLPTPASTP